jgi:ABC-type uncharacterized transport system permease subunit
MSQRLMERGCLLRPLISVLAGLVLAAILLQLSGYDAWEAYTKLWTGATGLKTGPAVGTNDLALGFLHVNRYPK